MSVRLGIIGTGRIAKRFATDGWQNSDVEITAVYNPRLESAGRFAAEHGIDCPVNKWETFLERVDAAYIAAPSGTHGDYIRKLLADGKHVLCEKPMVLKEEEARELFAVAGKKGLVLMEAIKTAYCPGFRALLETAEDGRIGEVRDVEAAFTKLTARNLREMTDKECGGSLTELGTYGCFAVLKLLGCDYEKISFSVQRNEEKIDVFTKVLFEYPGKGIAGTAKAGLGVKTEGELIISGTKGYLIARAPWWLTRHFEVRYEDADKKDVYDYPFEGNGLQYELGTFVERIKGMPEKGQVTSGESIALAGIMEQFLNNERKYRK